MKELKEYMEAKKKANALKWMKVNGFNTIQGFTQSEFNESVKQIKRRPQQLEEVTLKAIYGLTIIYHKLSKISYKIRYKAK